VSNKFGCVSENLAGSDQRGKNGQEMAEERKLTATHQIVFEALERPIYTPECEFAAGLAGGTG
jgi:hypothetical protein